MDSDSSGMSTQPFVWVIIPLIVLFTIGSALFFIWNRRRRRRDPARHAWPEDRVLVGGRYVRYTRGMRLTAWTEPRPIEGLNELGEAPPPYDTTKPPAIHEEYERRPPITQAQPEDAALSPPRDIEAEAASHEPVPPPPAVTTDSTRT